MNKFLGNQNKEQGMKKLNWRLASMFSIVGALSANQAVQAAGFAISETSGSFVGTAFAGAGSAKGDLSTMYRNPATMMSIEKRHAAAAQVSLIMPNIKFTNASSYFFNGALISGTNSGNAGSATPIPSAYLMYNAGHNLRLGVGVTSPWGLKTEYDLNSVMRYRAVRSQIETVNVNPNVAWRFHRQWTVGAGLQIQYMKAKLSRVADVGGIINVGAAGFTPGSRDTLVDVYGNDWGYGGVIGFIYEPVESTRLGLTYRSHIAHRLEGKATVYNKPASAVALIQAGLDRLPTSGDAVSSSLTTPETINFSFTHEIDPKWTVMGDALWTNWARIEDLKINTTNRFGVALPTSIEKQSWQNTIMVSLGTTYKPHQDWKLKLGLAYDQSPVHTEFRSPRLPDADRYWTAVGATYSPNHWVDLDLSYAHLFVKDGTSSLASTKLAGGTTTDNLMGNYKSRLDIVSLQARVKF